MSTVIEAKNIIKKYGVGEEQNIAVNNVSVTIERGEFISIMGPSGSGKSTLLYLLSGMDSFEGGSVRFLDKELQKMKETEVADLRRQKMGFIFQQPTMLKILNIQENIALPALREKQRTKPEIYNKVNELMEQMEIEEIAKRSIHQVSGGQLQRAGICRALINNPEIIFGDEPTGALNSKTTSEILKLLKAINESGTTILLVTHDPKVAVQSGHILFMKDGKLEGDLKFDTKEKPDYEKRMRSLSSKMEQIGI